MPSALGPNLVFGPKKDGPPVAADESSNSAEKKGGTDESTISFRSSFDPDKELQANELLVINPPQTTFTDTIRRLNFTLIERFTFQGLGFAVARLRIPPGMALVQARSLLGGELPGVIIDYNHRYDASQDPRRAAQSTGSAADQMKKPGGKIMSLAQAAVGWRDLPATCGKGIKIGMIDSGVDTSHPVLKGQDIEFRSFHSDNASMGDSEHGTAVAALLVGKPAESGLGGLLPGATLKAANMFEKSSTGANSGNVVSLLRGLDWLVREKVSVINMSIAGSNNAALEKGIAAATERSVLVVAAAGNWGRADKPAYPAGDRSGFRGHRDRYLRRRLRARQHGFLYRFRGAGREHAHGRTRRRQQAPIGNLVRGPLHHRLRLARNRQWPGWDPGGRPSQHGQTGQGPGAGGQGCDLRDRRGPIDPEMPELAAVRLFDPP